MVYDTQMRKNANPAMSGQREFKVNGSNKHYFLDFCVSVTEQGPNMKGWQAGFGIG